MGKCTKKAKMTADVALTDISLGVRTHAKTLADACYLQLRSRRLEKLMQPHNNSRRSCGKDDALTGSHQEFSPPPDSTQAQGSGIEASFGEKNYLEFDVGQRDSRESTPCSSTTTKRTCTKTASRRVRSAPPAHELDEFFAREEQSIQRRFVEKYNFDIVRDLPLRGRYKWVAVRP